MIRNKGRLANGCCARNTDEADHCDERLGPWLGIMGRVSLSLQGRKQNGDKAMAPKGKPKIYSLATRKLFVGSVVEPRVRFKKTHEAAICVLARGSQEKERAPSEQASRYSTGSKRIFIEFHSKNYQRRNKVRAGQNDGSKRIASACKLESQDGNCFFYFPFAADLIVAQAHGSGGGYEPQGTVRGVAKSSKAKEDLPGLPGPCAA
ncbi:hypothetical protein I7I51_03782 [Histoplasma capsulatum]|uniref:Uncharacterized protein n=1 Tax=Ajellomyces capsulatus TaxID=5037 RepID=A0A8A1M7D4_AJECA|nr:hypothetical protein I7I51_03782 [Histoplasma capsulatum]